MAQFFFPERDLQAGEKSVAYWSLTLPDTLVVFIHGFKGSAKSTWDSFPSLIDRNPEFSKCDVVFFGYDGANVAAEYSAIEFKDFINEIYNTPLSLIDPYVKEFSNRPTSFKYKKIIIVAHSLGAIITRRALLNAKKDRCVWVDITKMILFAPAHNGARDIKGLVMGAVTGKVKLLVSLGLYKYVVLDDLEEDSQTIQNIRTETNELLARPNGEGAFTKAAAVVWAKKDRVVRLVSFCQDPDPIPIGSKNHSNVCKPNMDEPYFRPIEILKGFI